MFETEQNLSSPYSASTPSQYSSRNRHNDLSHSMNTAYTSNDTRTARHHGLYKVEEPETRTGRKQACPDCRRSKKKCMHTPLPIPPTSRSKTSSELTTRTSSTENDSELSIRTPSISVPNQSEPKIVDNYESYTNSYEFDTMAEDSQVEINQWDQQAEPDSYKTWNYKLEGGREYEITKSSVPVRSFVEGPSTYSIQGEFNGFPSGGTDMLSSQPAVPSLIDQYNPSPMAQQLNAPYSSGLLGDYDQKTVPQQRSGTRSSRSHRTRMPDLPNSGTNKPSRNKPLSQGYIDPMFQGNGASQYYSPDIHLRNDPFQGHHNTLHGSAVYFQPMTPMRTFPSQCQDMCFPQEVSNLHHSHYDVPVHMHCQCGNPHSVSAQVQSTHYLHPSMHHSRIPGYGSAEDQNARLRMRQNRPHQDPAYMPAGYLPNFQNGPPPPHPTWPNAQSWQPPAPW